MTLRAYYLLADPEATDENQHIAQCALDLEQSTSLECVDYMYIEDEFFDKVHIAAYQ